MLHYKACNAGTVSTMSGAYTHIFSLHATSPQQFSTPHIELLKLLASYSYVSVVYGTMR